MRGYIKHNSTKKSSGFEYKKGVATYTDRTQVTDFRGNVLSTNDSVLRVNVAKSWRDTGHNLFGIAFSLFRIVLMLLLLVALMKTMLGGTQIMTFTGFLEMLTNAPTIDTSGLSSFVGYGSEVAELPIIGSALEFLINVTGALCYMAVGIVQVIEYLVYFVAFVF